MTRHSKRYRREPLCEGTVYHSFFMRWRWRNMESSSGYFMLWSWHYDKLELLRHGKETESELCFAAADPNIIAIVFFLEPKGETWGVGKRVGKVWLGEHHTSVFNVKFVCMVRAAIRMYIGPYVAASSAGHLYCLPVPSPQVCPTVRPHLSNADRGRGGEGGRGGDDCWDSEWSIHWIAPPTNCYLTHPRHIMFYVHLVIQSSRSSGCYWSKINGAPNLNPR